MSSVTPTKTTPTGKASVCKLHNINFHVQRARVSRSKISVVDKVKREKLKSCKNTCTRT